MNVNCLLNVLFSYALLGIILIGVVLIKAFPFPRFLQKILMIMCAVGTLYLGCMCLSSTLWCATLLYYVVIIITITVLVSVMILLFLMCRYKRLYAIIYDVFFFIKSRVLKNKQSSLNKMVLLKYYIRYVTQYIRRKEFVRTLVEQQPLNDHLYAFKLSFVNYGSMFVMFNEIFGHEVYYFTADTREPLIIDCGSNIGLALLYFKTLYPKARIIGFEPGPETFPILEKNVMQNHLTNVTIENKAVAKKAGQITFYTSKESPAIGGWSVQGSESNQAYQAHTHPVEATPLSLYITQPVDLLKIDIEGAEDDVIEGLAESGKLSLVKRIILEYHHHMVDVDQDRFSHVLRVFEDHGFGYQFNYVEVAVPEKKQRNVLILDVYNKAYHTKKR